ncbi:hypothetical protein BJ508DRAFT_329917 [Ascobolus immersus RN42]|uniref:Inhibitor I9 domain-containing protein n=1 Tax=Ascobolus immersus RN42 TaxID=1160509 RepID=A0A3N4HVE5_ASCIM|nr:hypothetical protein BJ508DRAFT_329917 [Ascobolus immersus RN42]
MFSNNKPHTREYVIKMKPHASDEDIKKMRDEIVSKGGEVCQEYKVYPPDQAVKCAFLPDTCVDDIRNNPKVEEMSVDAVTEGHKK